MRTPTRRLRPGYSGPRRPVRSMAATSAPLTPLESVDATVMRPDGLLLLTTGQLSLRCLGQSPLRVGVHGAAGASRGRHDEHRSPQETAGCPENNNGGGGRDAAIGRRARTHRAGRSSGRVRQGRGECPGRRLGPQHAVGNTAVGFTYGRSLAYVPQQHRQFARGCARPRRPAHVVRRDPVRRFPPIINLATLPPKSIANSDIAGSDQSRPKEVRMIALDQNPQVRSSGPGRHRDRPAVVAGRHPVGERQHPSRPVDGLEDRVAVPARERGPIAHAVTTGTQLSLLGGLLTLDNPRWEATAKSGGENSNVGTFTFTGGTFNLGIAVDPRTTDQAIASFGNVAEFARNALGFLGVTIEYPKVTLRDDGVEVSPVKFLIESAPLGSNFLSPLWQNPLVAGAGRILSSRTASRRPPGPPGPRHRRAERQGSRRGHRRGGQGEHRRHELRRRTVPGVRATAPTPFPPRPCRR